MKSRLFCFSLSIFLILNQGFFQPVSAQELDLDDVELDLEDEAFDDEEYGYDDDEEEEPRQRSSRRNSWDRERDRGRKTDFRNTRSYNYFLGVGYHMAPVTDLGKIEAEAGSIDAEFTTGYGHPGAVEITAGMISVKKNGIGFKGALTYQMARPIQTIEVTAGDETTSEDVTGTPPTLQFSIAELGLLYRWSRFYVLAMANYSMLKVSESPDESAENKEKLTGSAGFSAGIGWWISPRFSLEVQYKRLGFKVQFPENTEEFTISSGNGFTAGGSAVLLFAF